MENGNKRYHEGLFEITVYDVSDLFYFFYFVNVNDHFYFFVSGTVQGQRDSDEDEEEDDDDAPLVVSVTYLWHHPIIEMLGLNKPKPKIHLTNDFEHWTTGSFIFDLPPDLVLNENENYYVLPYE
jgi:hypothetical protein